MIEISLSLLGPTYANYGWASIINPSGNSEVQVKEILVASHERALRKIGK